MKGERALLLTGRAHTFFGPTSRPALPLLIGFCRHRLLFPISPPLMAEPLLSQPTAAGPLQGVSGMPRQISVSASSSSHTHLTNASPHGLEYIYCEG